MPRTEEGKAKSALNALKTGLTGRTVLLFAEETPAYQHHLAAFEEEYRPVGLRECELVQSIADTFWRLARIPALETAIFAKGRLEFADLFEEPHLIDAHTFLTYEKQIRNLHLQEARLVRRREKETAELRSLQQQRKEGEAVKVGSNFQLAKPNMSGPRNRMKVSAQNGDWLRILRLHTLRSGTMPRPRNSLPVPGLPSRNLSQLSS